MITRSLLFLFVLAIYGANAQHRESDDSLRALVSQHKGDTTEVRVLAIFGYNHSEPDSGILYLEEGLLLARKLNYRRGEADCLLKLGALNSFQGNFTQSIQYSLNALSNYKELRDKVGIVESHLMLQGAYRESGDYKNSLIHALSGERIAEANNVIGSVAFPGHRLAPLMLAEISQTYVLRNQLDSALIFVQRSIDQNELFDGSAWNFPVYLQATIQNMQGNHSLALKNYRIAKSLAVQNGLPRDTLQILSGMSTLFVNADEPDSAIFFAQIVARSWEPGFEIKTLFEAINNLTKVYKLKGNGDSTLKYMELGIALKDSIHSQDKDREIQSITYLDRLRQQEVAAAQLKYKSKLQLYGLLTGLFVMILTAVFLWRSSRQSQKAKGKIEKAYADLKSTQALLIQSEKMASLGELTAGIAHEIQNPMNFVNNFSEINTELIGELEHEVANGNIEEAKAIAKKVKENEQKIVHHGKRADAIVKGMLQHSRSSSGVKEATDINALADEYFRLAYHGIRAKDKTFNATMKSDYDASIASVNIISQDIGRVILNLITNAFYAVAEKKKQQPDDYEPTVSVSTRKNGDKIFIVVKDNGNGIPSGMLDKIFLPFFTTKPAGQGTGLGLSLSYDIVKAHGGELKVQTKEGEGSEFIIHLPA